MNLDKIIIKTDKTHAILHISFDLDSSKSMLEMGRLVSKNYDLHRICRTCNKACNLAS